MPIHALAKLMLTSPSPGPTSPLQKHGNGADTYLHRVGRAGRFGTKGLAITFVSSQADSEVLNQVRMGCVCLWCVLKHEVSGHHFVSSQAESEVLNRVRGDCSYKMGRRSQRWQGRRGG